MHKGKSQVRKSAKKADGVPSWDWAIEQAKERIKRLKESIRTFQKMRDTGERWRGTDVEKSLQP
jgi:hypothetical protein